MSSVPIQSDSRRFLRLIVSKELESIGDMLSCVDGIDDTVHITIKPEDLDREKADVVGQAEIDKATTDGIPSNLSAIVRLQREANRARRDYIIAESSHKQLMLGAYRTMYQRKLKLEKKLENGTYA